MFPPTLTPAATARTVAETFALQTLCVRLRKLEQDAAALAREAAVARGVRRIDDASAKLLANTHTNIRNARIQLEELAGLKTADATNIVRLKALSK